MPRLRSRRSGVVVNVSDATATLLAHRFEAVEDEGKSESKKAPVKRAASKSDDK